MFSRAWILSLALLTGCGASVKGLHSDCANGPCAAGQTCVSYYGVQGPSGPQFKTCEIKCDGTAACPAGLQCVTIADGPGRVCD